MSSGCAVRPGSASLPLDPRVSSVEVPTDRPGLTSAAALRAASIAAFFSTFARTCSCDATTDLREERDGLQCVCTAPLIAVEVEKMYAVGAKERQRGGRGGAKLPANLPEASEARAKAAAQLNVSPRIVQDAKNTSGKSAQSGAGGR